MPRSKEPVQVGPLLVQRTLSSSADYRVAHNHYWRGYICPWNTPNDEIGTVGKLLQVTSFQELERERNNYRAEVDPFAAVQLAYYEVLDAKG
jgi:hypothetical protein